MRALGLALLASSVLACGPSFDDTTSEEPDGAGVRTRELKINR